MGNRSLDDASQAAIDFLVEHELRTAKAASGKRLRAHCRTVGVELATIEASLLPTLVRHSGNAPDDEYEVTFAGFRASSRAAEVEAGCLGVVAVLREKWDKAGTAIVHHYELISRLVNTTRKRLEDWYLEVELPTPLLEPGTVYATLVKERSDAVRSVFRTSRRLAPLPAGDPYEWKLPYRVDDNLFWNQHDVVEQTAAKARAFVNGTLVVEAELLKIQNF
jgi:hypothetical protein